MSTLFQWAKDIGTLQLVIGGLIGVCLDSFIKRPKLVINGGGGGGGPGPGFHQTNLTVMNDPGLLGIRLGDTRIFGKPIHGYILKGIVFDRIPAHECRALLYDKKTGEFVSMLWWRTRDEPPQMVQTVTLHSGETIDLLLFARLDSQRSKYFVYEPESPSSTKPKIPEEDDRVSESRDFVIHLNHSYGRKTVKIDLKVVRNINGTLTWKTKNASGSI